MGCERRNKAAEGKINQGMVPQYVRVGGWCMEVQLKLPHPSDSFEISYLLVFTANPMVMVCLQREINQRVNNANRYNTERRRMDTRNGVEKWTCGQIFKRTGDGLETRSCGECGKRGKNGQLSFA